MSRKEYEECLDRLILSGKSSFCRGLMSSGKHGVSKSKALVLLEELLKLGKEHHPSIPSSSGDSLQLDYPVANVVALGITGHGKVCFFNGLTFEICILTIFARVQFVIFFIILTSRMLG